MKKIILILVLLICTVNGYSQQTLRFGQVTLKDTLNGQILAKDASSSPPVRADIYVKGLDLTGNISSATSLVIQSPGIALQSSTFPEQSININSDGSNEYRATDGEEHSFYVGLFDEIFKIDDNGAKLTGRLENVPVEVTNLGGGGFEIVATLGNKWYVTLTENSNITLTSVAEGQELTVFVTGGTDGAPFPLTWSIHGSSGTEFWYREVSNAPPTQTEWTDKYIFLRMDGILYCEHFPGESP